MECACTVSIDEGITGRGSAVEIHFCPLHAAAQDLESAGARLLIGLEGNSHPSWYEGILQDAEEEMHAAITRATGNEARAILREIGGRP